MRSIVGRFLEHSRIYGFGADPETAEYLIGSADLMPRNLDRRVEALVPVRAPALRRRLDEILEIELADDRQVWELDGDGIWHRVPTTAGRRRAPRPHGAGGRPQSRAPQRRVGLIGARARRGRGARRGRRRHPRR